jgi:hypothetical protein
VQILRVALSVSFSFCADKSQDVPREEEGKVKASSKERGFLVLPYSRMLG